MSPRKHISKEKLKAAIKELLEYRRYLDHEVTEPGRKMKNLLNYKDFLWDKKLDEVLAQLAQEAPRVYEIDRLVVDKASPQETLLLEHNKYKGIPKTNLTYRYDAGNTNTKTQDHIHVYQGKGQLYAINRDGSPHDGSLAKLGKKEIVLLKNLKFNVPDNGLLEWITLDDSKEYRSFKIEILLG